MGQGDGGFIWNNFWRDGAGKFLINWGYDAWKIKEFVDAAIRECMLQEAERTGEKERSFVGRSVG